MSIDETKNEILNHVATLNNVHGENVDPGHVSETLTHGSDDDIIRLEKKLRERLNHLTNESIGAEEPPHMSV